jgi:hypothetical protein
MFGAVLGLKFHGEDWMGGYASLKRRLYRLGHVSFFGLAIINLLFFFTATYLSLDGACILVASWGFVIGAISMPVCCLIMAHHPGLKALFVLPVSSLIIAGALTLWEVAKL